MAFDGTKGVAAGQGVASKANCGISLALQPPTKQAEIAPPLHRRPGKELMEELGTEEERKAIIVNMSRAKGMMCARFLAVGIFLSMLTISTRQVIDTMKKIWKVRGNVDMCPLEGTRFVLEFAEEGHFNHVTRGGPWRFREDGV
jgi:hypothetical protein